MSDDNDNQRIRKPLGLKRSVDAGEVKQTFSHGRTNKVVVEVKRRKLIGKPGEGFKIAMSVLDVFRSTVGAAALGFARRALDEALARTGRVRAGGGRLTDYQMVQGHLADMALQIDAAALLIYRAAWTKDQGVARISREAAMAKLYATEAAQKVIDMAVQLHGGDGVRTGFAVESLYREIRALRIYEGASEVQKIVIARQVLAGLNYSMFRAADDSYLDPVREMVADQKLAEAKAKNDQAAVAAAERELAALRAKREVQP